MRYVGVGKNVPAEQTNKHRKPHEVLAKEIVRVSDIILEVLDARFIDETRNLEIESDIKARGKKIIYVINKSDLVDVRELMASGVLRNLKPYVLISCKTHLGRSRLRDLIKIEVKRLRKENSLILKQLNEGMKIPGKEKEIIIKVDKRAHVGIVGYPNTGKSTLINSLSGGGAANAAPEAGFTKGIQKIRFNRDILILDSPGIIPESENIKLSSLDLKKHSKIGARAFNKTKEPAFVILDIIREYPGRLEKFYGIDANGDLEILLEKLGKKWGFLLKGGLPNVDKTARRILEDWQNGKIQR